MGGKESWAKMGKLNGKQNENYKWEKDDGLRLGSFELELSLIWETVKPL